MTGDDWITTLQPHYKEMPLLLIIGDDEAYGDDDDDDHNFATSL